MKTRIILTVALIFSLLLAFTSCKSSDYKKAVELLENGDYEEAYEIFSELGDYEDAEAYLSRFRYVMISGTMSDSYYDPKNDNYYAHQEKTNFKCTFNDKNLPDKYTFSVGEVTCTYEYTYDDEGNLIKEHYTDADGNESFSDYHKGKLIKNVFTNSDGGQSSWEYTYDEKENLIKEIFINPDNQTSNTEYTYGDHGKLIKEIKTAFGGEKSIVIYTYDSNGNLIKKDTDNGEVIEEYTYDSKGNLIKEITETYHRSMIQSRYSKEYTYNSKGDLLKEISACDLFKNGSDAIRKLENVVDYDYDYDDNGNLKKITTTSDDIVMKTVKYKYDSNGNLIKVEDIDTRMSKYIIIAEYKLVYFPNEIPKEIFDITINPMSDYQ